MNGLLRWKCSHECWLRRVTKSQDLDHVSLLCSLCYVYHSIRPNGALKGNEEHPPTSSHLSKLVRQSVKSQAKQKKTANYNCNSS